MKSLFPLVYSFCLLYSILFSACSKQENFSYLLVEAGSNRQEIKRVLDHYSKSSADSLKLKAAIFLIENLKYHKGSLMKYPKAFDAFYLKEDSIYQNNLSFNKEEKENWYQAYKDSTFSIDTLDNDLKGISANTLINRIDFAFKAWKGNRLTCNTTFKEFCEYVLPYRVLEEPISEKLPVFSDSIYQRHIKYNDTLDYNYVMHSIQRYFRSFTPYRHKNPLPDWGVWNFINYQKYACQEMTIANCHLFRYAGIPCAVDFIPQWMNRDSRHFWLSFPAVKDSILFMNGMDYRFTKEFTKDRLPKVFRYTFSPNHQSPYFLKQEKEEVPAIFQTPHFIDVTKEYFKPGEIQDIKVSTFKFPENNNIAYFCVPFNQGFYPIDFSMVDKANNSVTFMNIPDDIIGLPCYYDGNEMIPVNNLYLYKKGVTPIQIQIEEGSKTDLVVERKYPVKDRMKKIAYKLLGARIEASNSSDFKQKETLYKIKDTIDIKVYCFKLKPSKPYRYYRFVTDTSHSTKIYLAEIEFLTKTKSPISNKIGKLTMKSNTTIPLYKANGNPFGQLDSKGLGDFKSAHDEVFETYSDTHSTGLDFGKPIKIDEVRFLPRTANNGINPGDDYFLLYWDYGWQLAGEQTANSNSLEFKDIPEGTLYWLHNASNGKEELPFFMHKGEQIFINYKTPISRIIN